MIHMYANSSSRMRQVVLAAAILITPTALPGQATPADTLYETGIAEHTGVDAESALSTGEAAASGNPMSALVSWWPEDLVVAPIPGYSPQIGWKLALMAGYFLDLGGGDGRAPPSLITAMGLVTTNGSAGAALFGRFYLLEDRLRVTGGGAYFDVNYTFYGVGDEALSDIELDIGQRMSTYVGTAKYEVLDDLYAGLGFVGGTVDTGLQDRPDLPEGISDPRLEVDMAALLIPVEFDTRDDQLFPTTGWSVKARGALYREGLGADFDAESLTLQVNRYLPVRSRDVVALRGYVKTVGGDPPFFLLASFGGQRDLRGYKSGRYRDESMYAVQGEYRWRPLDRWVFTGFAGLGEVAPDLGGFFDDVLPAGGLGARFVLSPERNVSLSADLAVGEDGVQFYFGVGEAF